MLERAPADGSCALPDAVEDLVVPADLAADLADAPPPTAPHRAAFPRSVRPGILEGIVRAERPGARAEQAPETAEKAQVDERADQWR